MNLISQCENRLGVHAVSSTISRPVKSFSVYLGSVTPIDHLALVLRDRVAGLLAQRPDLDPAVFFKAIGRNSSWRSEFMSGKRTTNNLRLVIAMARFFRVPVAYLLDDSVNDHDAATLTLLGAWKSLSTQTQRDAVLHLAVTLARAPKEP